MPPLAWALLLAAPVLVLRTLPRRPERSFLCGARDALDRSHPVTLGTFPLVLLIRAVFARLRSGAKR